MAEAVLLVTEPRATRGSQRARQLRRQGRLPGVLYGHKEATLAVSLATDDLLKAIRQGARVVDLQAEGIVQKALIREVQWDHLGKEALHVDFARIAADERIVIQVRIELRGTAPGVTAGGVLDQPLHTLDIECLALNIPESIRVNIGELQIGGAIHVRELVLPPDVKAMAAPDAIVVHVTTPKVEVEAAAVPGEEQAGPEVIGRVEKAEEEPEGE